MTVETFDLVTPYMNTVHNSGSDGALYQVVQAHTTQADWTPPTVPALWAAVRQTEGPTVDPWVQPTGSSDAYQVGDRVTFEGQTWESTAAADA